MITSYKELKLGDYLKIVAIDRNEGLDDFDRQVGILSILTGLPEEELLHYSLADYSALARGADFLATANVETAEVRDEYKVGRYTLRPVRDFRNLETGQYIDFKTYAQDVEGHFPQVLSVLLVPEGHRYNEGYDVLDVQNAVCDLSTEDALAIVAFFLTSYNALIADSLNSSERAAKRIKDPMMREKALKEIAKAKEALRGSGVGSQT